MLAIYRRHRRGCPHLEEGRTYRRCKCPIWVDGRTRSGNDIRRATRLSNWDHAEELRREWEDDVAMSHSAGPAPNEDSGAARNDRQISLEYAWAQLVKEMQAAELRPSTIRKYELLSRQMRAYAAGNELRYLQDFTIEHLREFRGTWPDGPRSRSKKVERVRRFFRFAEDSEWIVRNPARKLTSPKVTLRPTLPFTSDEMLRIIAALDEFRETTPVNGRQNALRLRGFVFLLRYSGMRIGDVAQLSSEKLAGNKLLLHTQKTGTLVYVPLPDFVVRELELVPRVTDQFFFWSGKGNLDSCVRSWQTRLRRLFQLAKIPGHAHRFRDTFATELLLARVPIEQVSILLGHQSVRITERHYSPWVRSRQEQLEADIQRALVSDPVALLQSKGTNRVHGGLERPN